MKKTLLITSLFWLTLSFAQESVTCPVTGKTYNMSENNANGPHSGSIEHFTNTKIDGSQQTAQEKSSGTANKKQNWFPNQLNLEVLRQNSEL